MENEDTLPYWNARAVDAKIDCDIEETPINCEELTFARCMVKLIEVKLFNRKDVL